MKTKDYIIIWCLVWIMILLMYIIFVQNNIILTQVSLSRDVDWLWIQHWAIIKQLKEPLIINVE